MRWVVRSYFILLLIQYVLNPLVPAPKQPSMSSRRPQSVSPGIISPELGRFYHTDRLGLIVQADGDGGDTAQRTGMLYYVHRDPNAFERALDNLEVEPGIYVRHPLQGGFRSDPRQFSRDQQRPLVIAMGKYGMRDRLWRLAKQQLFRLGKYQNLDFIGPVGIGEYIRAFDAEALYPVLLVTDTCLFFGSIQLSISASFNPDEVDDNNHVMTLLQARDVMPTPFGWLAMKAYQTFRPKNLGNYILGKENAVDGALAWYHRAENGGNPYLSDAVYKNLENFENN